MTEPADETRVESKKRGRGFPVLALAEAIEVVAAAGANGGEHSQAAFAMYLGHSTAKSGPYRTKLAALRDYGLIARGPERITLTEVAREVVRAGDRVHSNPDLLRQCFHQCDIFHEFYDNAPKGQSIDPAWISKIAVLDMNVSRDSAQRFAQVFSESVTTAGLGRRTDAGCVLIFVPGTPEYDSTPTLEGLVGVEMDDDGHAIREPQPTQVYTPPSPGKAPVAADHAVAVQQVLPIDEGSITFVIRTSKPLPARAYVQVAALTEKLEQLASMLTEQVPEG